MNRIFHTLTLGFILSASFCNAQEAAIWKKFTGEINDPKIPTLLDYSYAGYKLG